MQVFLHIFPDAIKPHSMKKGKIMCAWWYSPDARINLFFSFFLVGKLGMNQNQDKLHRKLFSAYNTEQSLSVSYILTSCFNALFFPF